MEPELKDRPIDCESLMEQRQFAIENRSQFGDGRWSNTHRLARCSLAVSYRQNCNCIWWRTVHESFLCWMKLGVNFFWLSSRKCCCSVAPSVCRDILLLFLELSGDTTYFPVNWSRTLALEFHAMRVIFEAITCT